MDVNKYGNVIRTKKTPMTALLNGGELSRLFFDNRCLVCRGVLDTKKSLFQLARILDRSVNYNVTRLNCDHVATWVLVGRIEWTTAVFQVDPNIRTKTKMTELFDGNMSRMFFDNRCLVRRRVLDTKKSLLRMTRILNGSVNITRLNGDHVRSSRPFLISR